MRWDQTHECWLGKTETVTLNTILLATPVLEDVSIYWDDGKSHLLSYVFVTKSY